MKEYAIRKSNYSEMFLYLKLTKPKACDSVGRVIVLKSLADILTDVLDQCSGDYNYDFTPEGLGIYKIGDLVVYPEFQIASNIPQMYSPDYKGNVSQSYSIEKMKN